MDPKPETTAPSNAENVDEPIKTSVLQDRVRAATVSLSAAKIDRYTGKLACHRFMIPAHFLTPDPLDPKSAKLNLNMGHVSCIGDRCAIWNDEDKECFDATNARANRDLAKTLDLIDGHARMSAGK